MDLYSASSQSTSNALPLPVSRRWSPQANPTAKHSANTVRPRIQVGASRNMPVYSPGHARYSLSLGRLRLSRPGAWFCAEVVYLSKDGHTPRHVERVTATPNRQTVSVPWIPNFYGRTTISAICGQLIRTFLPWKSFIAQHNQISNCWKKISNLAQNFVASSFGHSHLDLDGGNEWLFCFLFSVFRNFNICA